MKINQTIVTTFLIGAIIGGVVIGVVDANRPQPLFSSAAPGECQPLIDQYVGEVNTFNNGKNKSQAEYDRVAAILTGIENQLENCQSAICSPILDSWGEVDSQVHETQGRLDDVVADMEIFVDTHPTPWSDKERSTYDEMFWRAYDISAELYELQTSLSTIIQQYEDAGCTESWEVALEDAVLDDPDEEEPPTYDYKGKRAY